MIDSDNTQHLDFYKTGIFVLEREFCFFDLAKDLFEEISRKNIAQTSISSDFMTYADTWKNVPIVSDYCLQDDFKQSSVAVQLHAQLISYFGTRIKTISFYNARSGLSLHLHRDMSGNLINGKLRIHVPILTNKDCFYLFKSKSRVQKFHAWQGGAFVLDTGYLHGVLNDSDSDRIHLMVELHVSSTIRKMLPAVDIHWFMHCCNFIFFLVPFALLNRFRHVFIPIN